MSDVKMEYEQTISREDAAAWLSQLARAFTGDNDAEFAFGPGSVKLHVPGSVRAELEVAVEENEVEIEIEFTWPLSQRNGKPTAAAAVSAKRAASPAQRASATGRLGHAGRTKRK